MTITDPAAKFYKESAEPKIEIINELIMEYLTNNCYAETATAFQGNGQKPGKSLLNRKQFRSLILEGCLHLKRKNPRLYVNSNEIISWVVSTKGTAFRVLLPDLY